MQPFDVYMCIIAYSLLIGASYYEKNEKVQHSVIEFFFKEFKFNQKWWAHLKRFHSLGGWLFQSKIKIN